VAELRDLYERVGLTEAMYKAPPFIRLAKLKSLIEKGDIDADFFWTARAPVGAGR
jgi:hypothetical protein